MLADRLTESIALYAGDHDLTDPYLSPLFGDFTGFPPTFLQAGTRDLFLSNTVRLHRKLRAAGVEAELHVCEAMPHGGFFGAPEDAEIARRGPHISGQAPAPLTALVSADAAHTTNRSQSNSRSGATLWLWPVPGSTKSVKSLLPVKQAGIGVRIAGDVVLADAEEHGHVDRRHLGVDAARGSSR